MICVDCGGYDELGTCVCFGDSWPSQETKQICHFCGVDLFVPPDVNLRMCNLCAIQLDHVGCCRCVRCNLTWLEDGEGSVCRVCRVL